MLSYHHNDRVFGVARVLVLFTVEAGTAAVAAAAIQRDQNRQIQIKQRKQ